MTPPLQAAIVAGGLGTRLGNVPKALIPIAGEPLIAHQVRWLKGQGLEKISVCLGFQAEAIRAALPAGIDLRVEKTARGTAGCIKDLAPASDTVVVYGDIFADADLRPLIDFHLKHPDALATLALIETDHPHDSDLAEVVDGRIVKIYRGGPGNLALAAVWVVSPRILELIPADRPSDFGRDVFPLALAKGLPIYGFTVKGTLADLGTPERLARFTA